MSSVILYKIKLNNIADSLGFNHLDYNVDVFDFLDRFLIKIPKDECYIGLVNIVQKYLKYLDCPQKESFSGKLFGKLNYKVYVNDNSRIRILCSYDIIILGDYRYCLTFDRWKLSCSVPSLFDVNPKVFMLFSFDSLFYGGNPHLFYEYQLPVKRHSFRNSGVSFLIDQFFLDRKITWSTIQQTLLKVKTTIAWDKLDSLIIITNFIKSCKSLQKEIDVKNYIAPFEEFKISHVDDEITFNWTYNKRYICMFYQFIDLNLKNNSHLLKNIDKLHDISIVTD
ncbi:hypothetical protein Catovirus_1_202 [Catovirus CTV1]|uniref:Uncharacterized protein n=1 Tax=Catovirus CTV1 TaxID=1977631 RepID=A0A1V0S8X0_9VIRU|nr:hypothetical protein Catovirus_1_202 [Catovirus CTV1]